MYLNKQEEFKKQNTALTNYKDKQVLYDALLKRMNEYKEYRKGSDEEFTVYTLQFATYLWDLRSYIRSEFTVFRKH